MTPPPARPPRRAKALALLLAWASVSLMFLALARPVRERAGRHWIHYAITAAVLGAVGAIAALGLWKRASRAD